MMARGGSLASPSSPPASAVASAHTRIRQEMAAFEVERNINTLHIRLSELYHGDEWDRTPRCLLRTPRSPTLSPGPVISRTPSSPGTPSLHSDSARGHTSPDAPTTPAAYAPAQSIHENGEDDALSETKGAKEPPILDAIARATQIAPSADATNSSRHTTQTVRKRKVDSLSHETTEQEVTSSKKRKVSSSLVLPHAAYHVTGRWPTIDRQSPNSITTINKSTLDFLAATFGRRTPTDDLDNTANFRERRSTTRRHAQGSRAYDNSIGKRLAAHDAKDTDRPTQSQTQRFARKRRRMRQELGEEGENAERTSTTSSKKRRSAKVGHQSAQQHRNPKHSTRRMDNRGHRPAAGNWKSRLRPRRDGQTAG